MPKLKLATDPAYKHAPGRQVSYRHDESGEYYARWHVDQPDVCDVIIIQPSSMAFENFDAAMDEMFMTEPTQ